MTTSALRRLGIRADVVIGPYRSRYTNLFNKLEFVFRRNVMKKLFVCCLIMLLFVSCFFGCDRLPGQNADPLIDLSTPFIGFRTEKTAEMNLQDYTRVELETLNNYQPNYGGYGVQVYFDTLTPQEQTLYRIFQYALDHAQTCIFLDDRFLEELTVSLDEVLCCLALDNPMLEQNLKWSSWTAVYTLSNRGLLGNSQADQVSGTILQVNAFSKAKLDKKLEAQDAARQILSQMPTGMTELEKAEYFYRYLGQHTQYTALEGDRGDQDYLYDALCVGKTNCDGFANAYSLMCHLADIPCMEKMYSPDESDEIGHTWNAICLDGVWYNVDATGSDEVLEECVTMRGFCTSDRLMENVADHQTRIPQCTTELIPPDCTVTKTGQAAKQIKDAYKQVKKTQRDYVIALFPDGEVSNKVMQEIANALGKNVSTRYYLTHDGMAVYYIFPR